MFAEGSQISSVTALDGFYVSLAEKAENEALCLPWYKTIVNVSQRLKRFRSEMTLPGLRLQAADGRKYFIPEAKFTGTAPNKTEAENFAADEACKYLKTFTQRSELDAEEWSIDSDNALFNSIREEYTPSTSSPDSEPARVSEGHHQLVIVPTRRRGRKKAVVDVAPVSSPASPSPSSSHTESRSGSTTDGDGTHLTHLSNEVHLLKTQIDRLNALVERNHSHPSAASITPASTSHRPEKTMHD